MGKQNNPYLQALTTENTQQNLWFRDADVHLNKLWKIPTAEEIKDRTNAETHT